MVIVNLDLDHGGGGGGDVQYPSQQQRYYDNHPNDVIDIMNSDFDNDNSSQYSNTSSRSGRSVSSLYTYELEDGTVCTSTTLPMPLKDGERIVIVRKRPSTSRRRNGGKPPISVVSAKKTSIFSSILRRGGNPSEQQRNIHPALSTITEVNSDIASNCSSIPSNGRSFMLYNKNNVVMKRDGGTESTYCDDSDTEIHDLDGVFVNGTATSNTSSTHLNRRNIIMMTTGGDEYDDDDAYDSEFDQYDYEACLQLVRDCNNGKEVDHFEIAQDPSNAVKKPPSSMFGSNSSSTKKSNHPNSRDPKNNSNPSLPLRNKQEYHDNDDGQLDYLQEIDLGNNIMVVSSRNTDHQLEYNENQYYYDILNKNKNQRSPWFRFFCGAPLLPSCCRRRNILLSRFQRILIVSITIILATIIVILLLVLLPKDKNDNNNNNEVQQPTTTQTTIDFDPLYIRAGVDDGSSYVDRNMPDRTWVADRQFIPESLLPEIHGYANDKCFFETSADPSKLEGNVGDVVVWDPTIFCTERYFDNIGIYNIPVLSRPATYRIKLYFNELFFSDAENRIFDIMISVGGDMTTMLPVVKDFDVFEEANLQQYTTVVIETTQLVLNGMITIELRSVVSSPKINAIEIVLDTEVSDDNDQVTKTTIQPPEIAPATDNGNDGNQNSTKNTSNSSTTDDNSNGTNNNTNSNNADNKEDGNKTTTFVPPADDENSTKPSEPLDDGNSGTNNDTTNNRGNDDTLMPAPTSAPIMSATASPTMEEVITGSEPTIPPTDDPLPDLSAIYINAGGGSDPVRKTDDGTVWVSDAKYVTSDGTGTTSESEDCMRKIQNVSFQILGCSERNFDDRGTYEIPVNDPTKRPTKRFRYILYFVETFFKRMEDRMFNIYIEDKFIGNYDIFDEAGGQYIVVQSSDEVTVEDGSLTIVFESLYGEKAKINAIEIQPIYESSE